MGLQTFYYKKETMQYTAKVNIAKGL